MKITVDLPHEQEQQLYMFLQHHQLELSEFIKSVILEKLPETIPSHSPYELGKTLFGRCCSGETERSVQRKRLIREKIHAKYCDR